MEDVCHSFTASCNSFQLHNVRPTLKPTPGKFDLSFWPGDEIAMDFTDMVIPVERKRYLLFIFNSFLGWPQAYPCWQEGSVSEVKALVNH